MVQFQQEVSSEEDDPPPPDNISDSYEPLAYEPTDSYQPIGLEEIVDDVKETDLEMAVNEHPREVQETPAYFTEGTLTYYLDAFPDKSSTMTEAPGLKDDYVTEREGQRREIIRQIEEEHFALTGGTVTYETFTD
ncbi:hypothetical protein COV18_03275 [Candidatus Woesearchaeota archaeon CG10_big_fil_rev_8_21_14_0_10_37_12]|nr:MAG: hypothetical protein COV18_03275 [Candidatus Woesearchaeota archaeon CG10_big_fil_rev_8_21_14_0_10_37_12]